MIFIISDFNFCTLTNNDYTSGELVASWIGATAYYLSENYVYNEKGAMGESSDALLLS